MSGEALTAREFQVLRLVAGGQSNAGICARLDITEDAAKAYVRKALRKVGAENRAHAVWLACKSGLLDPGGPVAVVVAPQVVVAPVVGPPAEVVAELIAVAEQVLAGKPSLSLRGQAGRALTAAGRRGPGGRPLVPSARVAS